MGYSTIELLTDGAVGTIRLNRPERMNAVIEEMYLEIHDALARTPQGARVKGQQRTHGLTRESVRARVPMEDQAAARPRPHQPRVDLEPTGLEPRGSPLLHDPAAAGQGRLGGERAATPLVAVPQPDEQVHRLALLSVAPEDRLAKT